MSSVEIALIISGIALLVSFISLWVSSLSPFKLKVSNCSPTFSLYRIPPSISGTKDGKTWWIPSFDVGMSFYNTGRLSGEILDTRIVAEFRSHRSERKYVFYPKWIVDYAIFQRQRPERFEWIENAVIREWYPILLKGQNEVHLHLVLEGGRWDQKESGNMSYTLEVISSREKKWIECGKYSLLISEQMFDSKSSHTDIDSRIEELRKL